MSVGSGLFAQIAPIPPIPPIPPIAEIDPVIISGGPPPLPPAVMMLLVLGSLILVGAILWPVARAIARRIEGRTRNESLDAAELDDLRHRVADLEERQHRMQELEERVDFAERLLADRTREAERLDRGRGPA